MYDLEMLGDETHAEAYCYVTNHARHWAALGATRVQWLAYVASLRAERNAPMAIPLTAAWQGVPFIAAACFNC